MHPEGLCWAEIPSSSPIEMKTFFGGDMISDVLHDLPFSWWLVDWNFEK
jgi:hypothetical protein